MEVSKARTLVTRLVTAGTAGLLIAIGLFAVLFHVVNVPFEPGPPVKPERKVFSRQVVEVPDGPVDIVKPPKPVRPDVPDVQTPTQTPYDPADRPIERGDTPEAPGFTRVGIRGPGDRITGIVYAGGSDQDVVKVVGIPPEYPARALIQGTEGWVRVRFTITPTGSVRDASVVSAEPRGVFDEAALTAIARWRYIPRVIDGVAVDRVGVETLIEFQLTD